MQEQRATWTAARFAYALILILTLGCSEGLPPPPEVVVDDVVLADFIDGIHDEIRAAPTSAEARGRLAMTYEVNGFTDAAIDTYAQAFALDPEEFSWVYFRALLIAGEGDRARAMKLLEQALILEPEYVPAWLNRGAWLLDEGHHDEALRAYSRAAELKAGTPATVGRARALMGLGRVEQAVEVLQPLALVTPHPAIFRLLGELYRGLGRTEDAGIAFARGTQDEPLRWIDPKQQRKTQYIAGFSGRLVHAQNMLKLGGVLDAIDVLEPLRELEPDDPVLLSNLSLAYSMVERIDAALEVAQHAVAANPDVYFLQTGLARIYRTQGNVSGELNHWLLAIELDPERPEAHEGLGMLLMAEGRFDESIVALDVALEKGSQNRGGVLRRAGMIEGARERWDQAILRFEAAVEENIADTLAHIYLGRCYAEVGRFEDARFAFAMAERLATHPDDLKAAEARLEALES